ncbi:uncharacterized protein LOC142559335 [Dermacentor variabilis]|uniref:uncharacterized protein LOC142559335 n=1 Tax=Dermacentor variabilis TaxID=34621 RepID=UPI003F5BA34A
MLSSFRSPCLDGSTEPLRFRSRKASRPHVTASPVLVEFGKLASAGQRRKRQATVAAAGLTPSCTSVDDDQGALMHAAAALYASCMRPGNNSGDCLVQPQALYRALCAEGARTLLILRDAQEIVHEWESSGRDRTLSSPELSPVGPNGSASTEINNNPPELGSKAQTPVPASKPWQRIVPLDRTASADSERRTQPGSEEDEVAQDSDDGGRGADKDGERDDRVWIAWSSRRVPSAEGSAEEDGVELTLCGGDETSTTSGRGSTCSATARDASRTDPFSDVFSDLSDSDSEMEEEEEETEEEGLQRFLRAVASRRRERTRALASWSLAPRHVGPEHRLLGCATFIKNYRIPGTRACFLSLLAVRKGFRQHGIGSYLLKQIKSPTVVGPYDALLVRAPTISRRFFIKHGFTDDIVLSSRFREADEAEYEGSLLCYLPPFDGHYPSLPGTAEWNRPEALAAMEEEVERWKQKSLESYQCQVTCLVRLRHEVLRLHALLQEQEHSMQALRKENCRLQSRLSRAEKKSARSLIETLEKEAADFERLCNLGQQLQQPGAASALHESRAKLRTAYR